MAPKRKSAGGRGRGRGEQKKAKPAAEGPHTSTVEKLLAGHTSYCEELGIDLTSDDRNAPFQWLCCSIVFGNRLSEKTTTRAAKGLIKSGLTDPKSVVESEHWSKIEALNSEGSVQRGPSMASRLEETAATVLDKYDGDLNKLREMAEKDPEKERKLIKEFKGFGDTAVNIFCREIQLAWDELFPFADERTLEAAGKHGLPSSSAKDIAELVDNDRAKYVKLLGAVTKANLRHEPEETKDETDEESSDDTEQDSEASDEDSEPSDEDDEEE